MKNIGTSSRLLRFHIVPEPPKLEGSPGSLLPEKQRSPSSRTTPAIAHRSGHAPSLGGPFCHPWLRDHFQVSAIAPSRPSRPAIAALLWRCAEAKAAM